MRHTLLAGNRVPSSCPRDLNVGVSLAFRVFMRKLGKFMRIFVCLSRHMPEQDLDTTLVEPLDACFQLLEDWLVADLGTTTRLPTILLPFTDPLRDSLHEIFRVGLDDHLRKNHALLLDLQYRLQRRYASDQFGLLTCIDGRRRDSADVVDAAVTEEYANR